MGGVKEEIITVLVADGGRVEIDLAGALDERCCGCEASALHRELASLGVQLKLKKVGCRLSVAERLQAKLTGTCRWEVANVVRQEAAYAARRLDSGKESGR